VRIVRPMVPLHVDVDGDVVLVTMSEGGGGGEQLSRDAAAVAAAAAAAADDDDDDDDDDDNSELLRIGMLPRRCRSRRGGRNLRSTCPLNPFRPRARSSWKSLGYIG